MQPDDSYSVLPHESGVPHFGASQIREQQFSQPSVNGIPQSAPSFGSLPTPSSAPQYAPKYSGYESTGGPRPAQYTSYSHAQAVGNGTATGSNYPSAHSTGVPPSTANSMANYSITTSTGQSQGPVYQTTSTNYHTREPRLDGTGLYDSPIQDQSVTNQELYSAYQQGIVTGESNSRYVSGAQGTYSASQYTTHRLASGATETSRVVGVEYGPQRVISVQQHTSGYNVKVVGEHFIEREIRVPKKIIHKDVYEVVVPEVRLREEIIEETHKVREKIREVARPVIEERIIEVPEIEIVEKIVEVPQIEYKEKIREQIQVQKQERIVEVPVVVNQERVVEVPEVQYREVPVERVVEVPEILEQVIVRQVPVPQYVDKPVPQYVEVEVANYVDRNIPVPVEAIVAYEFRIPRLKGIYTKVTYPVYLPRFVETPIPAELYDAAITSKAEHYLQQISSLTRTAASLCEIENLAFAIMSADLHSQCQQIDLQSAVLQAWRSGLQITTDSSGRITSGMTTGGGIMGHVSGTSHAAYSTAGQTTGYTGQVMTGSHHTTATTNRFNTIGTHGSPSGGHHQSRLTRRTEQSTGSPSSHHQ